jgi:hypothetical protein
VYNERILQKGFFMSKKDTSQKSPDTASPQKNFNTRVKDATRGWGIPASVVLGVTGFVGTLAYTSLQEKKEAAERYNNWDREAIQYVKDKEAAGEQMDIEKSIEDYKAKMQELQKEWDKAHVYQGPL